MELVFKTSEEKYEHENRLFNFLGIYFENESQITFVEPYGHPHQMNIEGRALLHSFDYHKTNFVEKQQFSHAIVLFLTNFDILDNILWNVLNQWLETIKVPQVLLVFSTKQVRSKELPIAQLPVKPLKMWSTMDPKGKKLLKKKKVFVVIELAFNTNKEQTPKDQHNQPKRKLIEEGNETDFLVDKRERKEK